MKTLGFLGGMSYHSTALYYTSINGHVQRALGGAASAPMIMHSFNHAETSALFAAGHWDAAADKFIAASKHLKAAGAQSLAIGCNIGHKVAGRVEMEERLAIDKAVFQELGAGVFREETRAKTAGVVGSLIENEAQVIVLACTELQFIVKAEDVAVPLLDTMELHAREIADWVLAG